MNILIVCDNFTNGGLEKHIQTLYDNLKDKNQFYFAIGNYKANIAPESRVYTGFHFSANCSVEDFCSDVERLTNIINDNKIDVINVHPFYAIFPILFVAHLTNTKVIYTYHGAVSFTFPFMYNDSLLFDFAVEKLFSSILCVNEFGVDSFNSMGYKNTVLLPNPVDCKRYKKTKVIPNKKWALVSRLDIDKKKEILKFLEILPKLDIEQVDIYGTGTEEDKLKEYVNNNKLNVLFEGYIDNLNEELLDKYNGVIGLGRVAMEGLCMNYPVLLIGYGKIMGLITKENIDYLKTHNFVNSELGEIKIESLNKDLAKINDGKLSKYLLRHKMINYCDVNVVAKKYVDILNKTSFGSDVRIVELYEAIKGITNKETNFYNSLEVSEILVNRLRSITRSLQVRNMIFNISNIINIKHDIWSLNTRLINLEKKMDGSDDENIV